MKILILICFILSLDLVLSHTKGDGDDDDDDDGTITEVESTNDLKSEKKFETSECWMTLKSPELFRVMDEIDERYADVLSAVQKSAMENELDSAVLAAFIHNQGAALREFSKQPSEQQPWWWWIPSGVNIGSNLMMRLKDSMLFFHRLKLRNETYFRVDHLENHLNNMELFVHLSMNDLHLVGAYERSLTDADTSVLIYAPTFGEVKFVLKNVRYKMQARYRLIEKRLTVESVSSEMFTDSVLMSYANHLNDTLITKIENKNLATMIDKLKIDFDEWLKDYFNDYLIHMDLSHIDGIEKLSNYDKEKSSILEEYADVALEYIKDRIRQLRGSAIRSPTFNFKTVQGLHLQMYDGVLYGLDTIYRRSVPTGVNDGGIRKIDFTVGFSNLKVMHKYEAVIPPKAPALVGTMTLSANELTAHMSLSTVSDPESIDIDIEYLENFMPESLTVEGAANLMIARFREMLELQIISVMSNSLIHSVNMIRSLPRCVPYLPGIAPRERKKPKHKDYMTSKENIGRTKNKTRKHIF